MKYVLITILLYSCGADQFSKVKVSSSENLTTNNSTISCMCSSDYSPVCSIEQNKNYDNACIAKCFGGTNFKPGHCACDNSRIVCGTDNKDYLECDAINSKVEIAKYIPCNSTSM